MNKVIYMPKGRAAEYSELAANLYTGCGHVCRYCFAPLATHSDRVKFHADVQPRKDILKKLEKEAPDHEGREVLLCFTCDPYGPELDTTVTREAIKILHAAGVGVNILTKGGLRMMRDMDLFQAHPELTKIGASLTFEDLGDSIKWEPHAAVPYNRIEMLNIAHNAGIRTWASLEPVIDPKQTLELIRLTAGVVDHYKVGKWNYDKGEGSHIDWAQFLRDVTALLELLDKDYYVKKDLAAFSGKALE